MKTEWTDAQLDAIEAAMIAEGHLEIEVATVRIRLTARKLRGDCLVMYDYENCGATWGYCRADRIPEHGVVNVRPLITVDEAREKLRRVLLGRVNHVLVVEVMAEVDKAFDEYQYGPTDE